LLGKLEKMPIKEFVKVVSWFCIIENIIK
jgi:hypothetical protein